MISGALAMVAVLALITKWQHRALPRHGRAVDAPATPPKPTEWADVADAIAHNIRAGDSLRGAFARMLDDYTPNGTLIRAGAQLDDIVRATNADVGAGLRVGPDEMVVMRAVQTAWALGGPAAQGLHTAAALLRERHALRAEARAHSAQARASAHVLTSVPAVFAALGAATSASFRAVVATPAGALAIAAGVVLNLAGWTWMRRTVQRATA